jgi:hypothetical protein
MGILKSRPNKEGDRYLGIDGLVIEYNNTRIATVISEGTSAIWSPGHTSGGWSTNSNPAYWRYLGNFCKSDQFQDLYLKLSE